MNENIFNNLPDFPVEYSTDNIVRKAKKKLREIEVLKTKESITPEEKQKMKLEKYWKIFIPSSYTLFENNNHNITHSFRIHPVQKEEECPICLNKIRNNKEIVTNCCHTYCSDCITTLIKKSKCIKCSLCRSEIIKLDFHDKDDMFEIMKILSLKSTNKNPKINC
jgi:hypothetical protein